MTPSRTNSCDFAEKHAALFAEARVDEFLIVDAAEPAGVKAARKRHFHFVLFRFRPQRRRGTEILFALLCVSVVSAAKFVQRLPINPRDVGDVFRRLEPAFDFQRRDAGADQVPATLPARPDPADSANIVCRRAELACRRKSNRKASGTPARIRRDWPSGRRAIRSSGIGRNRRRTTRHGRKLPAAVTSWAASAGRA